MGQVVGTIPCPIAALAGEEVEADLCLQTSGRRVYYIRSSSGTLQCIRTDGQRYIQRMIEMGVAKIFEPGKEQDEAAQAKANEAAETIRKARRDAPKPKPEKEAEPPKAEKSMFDWLLGGDEEDE